MQEILNYIKANPGVRQADLCKVFGSSSITEQIGKLRRNGYITREVYKRTWILYPTDKKE